MASVRVQEITRGDLSAYAAIPNSFRVESVVAAGEIPLHVPGPSVPELPVAHPYEKQYAREDPMTWAMRYPLARWGLLGAFDGEALVGGAAVVTPQEGMVVPAGRTDVAVLWDLRVKPSHRGLGAGRMLIAEAAVWARERGFATLGIETQDVNAPACRLYAACGCRLARVVDDGYAGAPDVAHEKLLVWHLPL